jgi:hypothetical protein
VRVQKTQNHIFIDLTDVHSAATRPACEVSQASKINVHGDGRVSTFVQEMRKSINVGRKLAVE